MYLLHYLLLQVLPHVHTLLHLPCEKVFDVVLSGPAPVVVVTVVTLLLAFVKQLLFLESIILTVATLFPELQLLFAVTKLFPVLESLLSPHTLHDVTQSPIIFPNLLFILQIIQVITAVIYAKKLYNIANISKVPLGDIINATIKYMAKNVAPTSKGHFNIFCNTIANIIVATGNAKKTNNVFILSLSIVWLYFYLLLLIFLLYFM